MSHSTKKIPNYIACFLGAVVLGSVFFEAAECYEVLKKTIAKWIDNDKYPYEDKYGYIKGGLPFDGNFFDEAGKGHRIDHYTGNVVIVCFSTTWCHNCPGVLSSLEALQQKLHDLKVSNVKIVALNLGNDSVNTIKVHYKAHDLQLLDVYQSVAGASVRHIRAVPTCVVFNGEGKPVWGYAGGNLNCAAPEFVEFIIKLAKQV